jgi:hypothetical protein
MDADQIKADLESKRKRGAVLKRIGGLKGMAAMLTGSGVPRQARAVLSEIFSSDRDYFGLHLVRTEHGEVGSWFANHTEADWRRDIQLLVPHIAPSVEAGLKALERRPYQEGMHRKPFRSAHPVETLTDMRGRWLLMITCLVGEYDADIRWIAERCARLTQYYSGPELGWLLAGAMDIGDSTSDAVFEILRASALGEHETGEMSRPVLHALMSTSRPDAWELVEKLLLAAQRQEGLRQSILEAIDESHPQAFRRMVKLILDQNLSRFSSVVRAADTWFGFMWDGSSGVKIDSILERALRYLDDPAARAAAMIGEDPESAYLALWSIAFDDIESAIVAAEAMLESTSPAHRFVATHLLGQSIWTTADPPLVDMLADPELNVAARALDSFVIDKTGTVDGAHLFDQLEGLIQRMPKRSVTLKPLVWPWWARKLEKPQIAGAMAVNASAVAGERLLPYVPELSPSARAAFVRRLSGVGSRWEQMENPQLKRKTRFEAQEWTILLDLMGDSSADVRTAVFDAIRDTSVSAAETERLIELLERKPGDLRNGCLTRLATLPDRELLAAADRLVADASEGRRVAGLELLRAAAEAGRMQTDIRSRMEKFAEATPAAPQTERAHVAAMLEPTPEKITTDDALGLNSGVTLRKWPEPRARNVEVQTKAARDSLAALAELVLEHQNAEITLPNGETRLLVQAATWDFGPSRRVNKQAEQAAIPLESVWRSWAESRPASLRDRDGFELIRALVADHESPTWKTAPTQTVMGLGEYHAGTRFLSGLMEWCAVWDPPREAMTFLVDGFESSLAKLTSSDYRLLREHAASGASTYTLFSVGSGKQRPPYLGALHAAQVWLGRLRQWKVVFPNAMQAVEAERVYGLLRGFEERSGGTDVLSTTLDDFMSAYRAGAVDTAEFTDLLVGRWSKRTRTLLRELSTRKPPKAVQEFPELLATVERCRRRIVEVETRRGDRTTAASRLALDLRATGGLDTLMAALPALGKSHFARTFSWTATGASRQETLSHLVLRSIPRDDDSPAAFGVWARKAKVGQARLIELALYAPQWAEHVNHVVEWPGLEDAVWWVQAHTKDDRSWQLQELKEIWAAEVSERTPLSAGDLTEGGVDVAWFKHAHATLGADRWKTLDNAAKYAASAAGHTRAQLFSRAMGGVVTADELLERIETSRHQDSVRALGLLPLAEGEAGQADLLKRYQRLQAFHREARQFGSQRQQSERRAVAIGLANLARTAGYRDPQRLTWAMEQVAVADLARGAVVLEKDDVSLTLSINEEGVPSLAVQKNGKVLKSIPASLKKDEEVEELKDRLQELKRQRSRVRDALEEAMIRGDRFTAPELRTLFEHPILAPAIAKLIFIGDDVAGYPAHGGRMLRDHGGDSHILGNEEEVRVAHPHDLFVRGDWSAWQRECFVAERVQPFKQLFRELYPITDSERGKTHTSRYAGHQVNPRQALALLGSRGWVARPDEGVTRTFHEEGLTARLSFQEGFFTPAEIEGLTLEGVLFTKKGEFTELPLADIPPRVFSEALRDVDLVVSVAHRGGVDPEATASTVEMRASLVRETATLLGLENVEVAAAHVMIHGTRADYSVHLGSAGVMVMPGTAIPIIAVHSQHRGRLFLPFADDDPRTAEVLSKVLLLARDKEIRDPNILEWIREVQGGP